MKFLVVEDDAAQLTLYKRHIEKRMGAAVSAESAQQAKLLIEDESNVFDGGIICDGLYGEYRIVHEAAARRNIHMTLVTSDLDILKEAKSLNVSTVDKLGLNIGKFVEGLFATKGGKIENR